MSLIVKMTRRKGRGVFTTKPIHKGGLIEVCPVIPMSGREHGLISGTVLNNHAFTWPGPKQTSSSKRWNGCAICLGLGSVINHDDNPNAQWTALVSKTAIMFY